MQPLPESLRRQKEALKADRERKRLEEERRQQEEQDRVWSNLRAYCRDWLPVEFVAAVDWERVKATHNAPEVGRYVTLNVEWEGHQRISVNVYRTKEGFQTWSFEDDPGTVYIVSGSRNGWCCTDLAEALVNAEECQ